MTEQSGRVMMGLNTTGVVELIVISCSCAVSLEQETGGHAHTETDRGEPGNTGK